VQLPRAGSIEEKVAHLDELLADVDEVDVHDFQQRFDMSWIYHDSALEGVVHSFPELNAALDSQVVSDSSLLPAYDEIRQHKAAIDLVRDLGEKKRAALDLETLRKIYGTLAPDEVEQSKGKVQYRKDTPMHRVYFHDILPPDKIAPAMVALFKWIDEEKKAKTHPVRLAAKAHHKVLSISPFPKHSGKVARLFMNLMLLRQGYPPAVIHATERQRYYDALKTNPNAVATIVHEALVSSVESSIRHFEELSAARESA
jgi:Fic family protein